MPVVAAGAALVAGASIAAGGVAAAFISANAIIAFAAKVGASLVLSGIAQELAPEPNIPEISGSSLSGESRRNVIIRQPLMSREVVYGRVRKSGSVIYIDTHGGVDDSGNEFLDLIVVFSWKRVKSIGNIYLDGRLAVFSDGTIAPFYQAEPGKGSDYVTIQKRLGTDNQTAFTLPKDKSKWTFQHRLLGCAAVCFRLRYDPNKFPNGIPNITADIEGRDLIEQSTGVFGYTRNAAHCIGDWMTDPDIGLGLQRDVDNGLDFQSLETAAVISDEDISLATGGVENRYNLDGVVDCSRSRRETLRDMLRAMAGWAVCRSGRWHVYAGAYEPPSVSLTKDDAREEGLIVQTRVSRGSNFNAVRGTFFSPDNDWQPDSFPSVTSPVYQQEDGGETVYRDVQMPFVTSPTQAQRVAKIILQTARQQQRVQFFGKLSAFRVTAGENALLTYDRWGYNSKPFFIEGVSLKVQDGSLVCDVNMKETSPLVFDWDVSEEQIYSAAPRTSLPSRLDVGLPGRPSLEETVYLTRAGTSLQVRIEAEWLPSDSPYVRLYDVEARRVEDLEGVSTGEDWLSVASTESTFARLDNITPGFWQFRVRGRSHFGVTTDWVESLKVKIVGLSEPPSVLTGLRIQSAGGLAFISWDESTDGDVRIGGNVEIRHSSSTSPTWGNSRFIDSVSGNTSTAVVPLIPGSYLIRSRDSSGFYGPSSSIETSGAQAISFVNVETLTADPTFSGDKSGTTVDAGNLKLSDPSNNLEGSYKINSSMDFTTVKPVRLRTEVEFTTELLDDGWFDRPVWFSENWFSGSVEGLNVIPEARVTEDDPSSSPTWSDWFKVDNTEIEARGVEWRVRLQSDSVNKNILVDKLKFIADEVA